jgi:hypothetical protein
MRPRKADKSRQVPGMPRDPGNEDAKEPLINPFEPAGKVEKTFREEVDWRVGQC